MKRTRFDNIDEMIHILGARPKYKIKAVDMKVVVFAKMKSMLIATTIRVRFCLTL